MKGVPRAVYSKQMPDPILQMLLLCLSAVCLSAPVYVDVLVTADDTMMLDLD